MRYQFATLSLIFLGVCSTAAAPFRAATIISPPLSPLAIIGAPAALHVSHTRLANPAAGLPTLEAILARPENPVSPIALTAPADVAIPAIVGQIPAAAVLATLGESSTPADISATTFDGSLPHSEAASVSAQDASLKRVAALLSTAKNLSRPPADAGWKANQLFFEEVAAQIANFKNFALAQYGNAAFDDHESVSKTTVLERNARAVGIWEQFRALGAGFEKLLVDPALVQRANRFELFLKNHPTFTTPWEARLAFRASTDDLIFYRAMALSSKDAALISTRGIEANIFRDIDTIPPHQWKMFGAPYRNIIALHVEYSLTGLSSFISVTAYPEIAMGVTRQFTDSTLTPHIFRLRVKESDLVRIDPDNNIWSPAGTYFNKKIILRNGNHSRTASPDYNVESMVFFRIPPEAIDEIPVNLEMEYEFR